MIKRLLSLSALFIIAVTQFAQAQSSTSLYKFTPPWFGNGDKAIKSYFLENILLKERDFKFEIKGAVIVKFMLTKEGELKDFVIIDSTNSVQLNQDVIKCLKLSKGLWHRATINEQFCDITIIVDVRLIAGDSQLYGYYVESNFEYSKDAILFNNYYNIGSDLASKGLYQEALPYFDVLINQSTTDVDALYNRGVCHMKLGDMTKACADWQIIQNSGKSDADKLLLKYCGK
ncbi:MAG: tetratricopeptide repeat protein [Bacteroidetes bacterium]|nr:tetratricopeptide repeat protein [Bacteroidota bacterium]